MRNEKKSKKIIDLVEKLPIVRVENLGISGIKKGYLRVILSRKSKKGVYTSKKFVENSKSKGEYSDFLEFLASEIYAPSYLSLDYILYKNNILTEIPEIFTLMTKNKTAVFSNKFGNFFYHKIKDSLFLGFDVAKKNNFLIYRATKIKALFDFLYLRKNLLGNKTAIKELRLNLEDTREKEKKELLNYIKIEGSIAMKNIYLNLFEK
ncbi:hypothetical protein KKA09_00810 [Patescibacteria group bacterium]|nr:hypothetical protein [Patescibacteria group bacterium]